jgi:hypothetical protein
MHGQLSPRAGPVKTGTPLTLAPDGYVIAAPGEPFDMICANSPIGDQIHGFAIATVETYKKQFRMGDKYRIDYIGPDGQIYLIDDATGPNAGQQRTVMHSYESTGQITTTSSFGSTPVVGNTGEFWPGDIAADTINANINTAIGRGSDVVNTYLETVPTIDTTRLIVNIPANFTRLVGFNYFYNGVIYDYALTDWLDSNYDQALVRGRKLYLSNPVTAAATDMVIQGYRVPALPTQDSDVIEMNPEFVKLMAAALTEAGDAAMPGYDPEASTARSQVWFREAMDVRQNMINDWLSDTRGIPL